jgi:DNA modification methylase
MANNKKAKAAAADSTLENLADYRFPESTRKNNPPAKIAAEGYVPLLPKAEYQYSPRRPPELRFDPTGRADELPELLAIARERPLTEAEAWTLAEALRVHEPWLEWAGKRETRGFAVDPVALHIHERVSAQAILKVAARQDIERSLFADPEQEYNEAVQFYKHDVDWSNRLILGDSLQVMSSLARREDLAGKVQMIYLDPPYGIKFASNFQPEIGKRDVKDKESDLTREPEMVKAYRDTWTLGVHSYLAYLRDRLIVAKELLADTGSIFVQIGEENVHSVRAALDEVFGRDQSCGQISVKKTGGQTTNLMPPVCDYLLWYSKDRTSVKYRQQYKPMTAGEGHSTGERYDQALLATGETAPAGEPSERPSTARFFRAVTLSSNRPAKEHERHAIEFRGRVFEPPPNRTWTTTPTGIGRLADADRVHAGRDSLNYLKFLDDFPANPIGNLWEDVTGSPDKIYVVQTNPKVIQRCLLMTTDPGDLVLDPTCGSGTTAYVAEQWGRRWITIDTSRVALAIARQRLLTAKYDYLKLKDESKGVSAGFRNKTVPHVTLKSIAQNAALDPIFAKHEPVLEARLAAANAGLKRISDKLRNDLRTKLALKQKQQGKKSITDADHRRWELPKIAWQHWEVPFDTDPDYPPDLKKAVEEYRSAWRAKMDEVNACIAANAEQEELVDQPEIDRKITRVSGPFTVEAVQPPEMSLGDAVEVNNVTQVLGVRAFGSQLLCEQVVGRGLRRMDYVPDPFTGLLTEEYVDVYGIPFSVIPFKGRAVKGAAPEDKPKNHVHALPERKAMEIRFPVVEGYAFALQKNLICCDVSRLDRLEIEPNREPTATFVRPTVGYQEGSPSTHTTPFEFLQQDRQEYYAHTHLQTIQFQIARQIVEELTVDSNGTDDKRRRVLRLQSRHQLFPQVFQFVEAYVRRKVNFNGAHKCELGLEKYVRRIVERLRDGIVPDASEGELPLLPILNRYKSTGTTTEVDFKTTRPCHATVKSHIDQVVLDNLSWEASASFRLESSSAVAFYARNDHLGLLIPYEYTGLDHVYEPDFLLRLSNGATVILEIKGYEDDQDKAKHTAAKRWVIAVNNWGQLGEWRFHVCKNPQLLDKEMEFLNRDVR